jgi:hypothetical protein
MDIKAACPRCETLNFRENARCSECGSFLPSHTFGIDGPTRIEPQDRPSTMLNVFSILCPLIGVAAWLILMDSAPRRSAEAGYSALIGILLIPALVIAMPVVLSQLR